MTNSRSIWITFLVVLFFMYVNYIKNQENKEKRDSIFINTILIIFIFLFGVLIFELFSIKNTPIAMIIHRFSELKGSDSFWQRFGAIRNIIKFFLNKNLISFIIGNGSNSSKLLMSQLTVRISNFGTVDNQYASILYDFGIITFLVIILFFMFIFLKSFYVNELLSKVVILGILSFMLAYIFFDGFTWLTSYYLFFILIGIYCGNSLYGGIK